MQPGEAFLVVGHTLSTIYSTTTDIASYHGKVVLFTGDMTATRECIPVVLPTLSAFAWKKCRVVDDRSKLAEWYADNPVEYGNLWDPTGQDGTRMELLVPRKLTLPLWAAKLYHNFNGAVMPDATLGRRIDPNRLGTTVGIQGNMAIVQNMSGIIATEVGKGLGVAMQNATKAS